MDARGFNLLTVGCAIVMRADGALSALLPRRFVAGTAGPWILDRKMIFQLVQPYFQWNGSPCELPRLDNRQSQLVRITLLGNGTTL